MEKFGDKISLTGCKRSSLNSPGTETPVFHPVWVNSLSSFSAFPFSGVIRIGILGLLWEACSKDSKIWGQNQLNRQQMVQFVCPRHWNPCVSSSLGEFPFLIFCLPFLWGIKNWHIGFIMGDIMRHVQKIEILCDKIILIGSKGSSLNAPGTETPVFHPVWVNTLFSFSAFPFSGVIRINILG